jgi:tRNA nucleotidyltransferase/poly(A) polymerase
MRAMLVHANRGQALQRLRQSRLESYVLPELSGLDAAQWEAAVQLAGGLQQPALATVLAALVHTSASDVDAIAGRWKLPNHDTDLANWLLTELPVALKADEAPWPRLQRVLVHEGSNELVDLAEAIAGSSSAAVQLCRAKLALPPGELNPPPVLTGADLIAAGLKPGPEFGRLLEQVRDAQLDGEVSDTAMALALAKRLAEG